MGTERPYDLVLGFERSYKSQEEVTDVAGGAEARQFGWRDAVRVRTDVATAASVHRLLERRVVGGLADIEVAL